MNESLVLKDSTRSLCPHCYREIPASIIEQSDGIYMEKKCPDHGSFRSMVEKDASVYKKLMNHGSALRPRMTLVIPITHRCNLRCKMCFLPDDGVPDPSKEAIFRLIDRFEGRIVFSGGEPTLRRDLPELIDYAAKKGKHTCIATNGLTLRDKQMVDTLVDAGLTNCLFSMNGLSDNIFKKIEGQPLIQKKMEALENLRGARIKPFLSTTLISGVNTGELPALADFYIANRDLFFAWRLRTQAAIGRHTDAGNLWMSDMLNLICKALHIDCEKLLKNINPERIYHGVSHLYFNVLSTTGENRRTLGYQTINQRTYRGMSRNDKQLSGGSFSRRGMAYADTFLHSSRNLLSSMSLSRKTEAAFYGLFRPSQLKWFNISLFAWPDAGNVDLEEMDQTGIYHVGPGGEPMPFVQAIILNNGKPDWNWKE